MIKVGQLLNRKVIVLLIATALYLVYQFYPQINSFVAFGLMFIPFVGLMGYVIAPWLVAMLLCVAIAIIYWLADIRSSAFTALISFSVSYVVISWLVVILQLPAWYEFLIGILVAISIFGLVLYYSSKFQLSDRVSVIVGAISLVAALYSAPLITRPIQMQQLTSQANRVFQTAVESLSFTPYYPTYKSPELAMTEPKLNGYAKSVYTHETVTFTFGKGNVKEGEYLAGQDKVMNFTDNCTIYTIWFVLNSSASIEQSDIDHSLRYPQKCTLLETTPSGKKIYYNNDGDNVWFYVLVGRTNFIIDFDNLNHKNYSSTQQAEIIKVIDSLQPLDKTKLQNGNSYGSEF